MVGPADISALAVHLMTNTGVTGATYDIDGGQQPVEEFFTDPQRFMDAVANILTLMSPCVFFLRGGGGVPL